jgi:hypothetical protein
MKPWIISIGVIFIIFGVYPPFHLMSLIIGIIIALIGVLLKTKVKKNE